MNVSSADQSTSSAGSNGSHTGVGAQFTSTDLSAAVTSIRAHQCPNCGVSVAPDETICPGCGIRLRKPARKIRCRHCHHSSSSELVICPHCGRELRPAPSRLLTWGVPLLLVGLLVAVLFTQLDSGSLRTALNSALGNAPAETELGQIRELSLNTGSSSDPAASGEVVQAAATETATSTPTAESTATAQSLNQIAVRDTSTATPEPKPTGTNTPTATPTATQTPVPTSTFTQTPTPVPTVGELSYTVQSGDTLSRIARQYGVSVDGLLIANDMLPEDAPRIREGMVLVIPEGGNPPPTAAAATTVPTAAPTATVSMTTYTVQPGDSPARIAQRFGITTDALLSANGLTAQDAPNLQVGKILLIPGPGQVIPSPTPLPTSTPTATPTSAIRMAAPQLVSPSPNTPINCRTARDSLVWEEMDLAPGDEYELHLGYVDGPPGGESPIVWIIVRTFVDAAWGMESDLCSVASNQYNREWRWFVQIVNNGVPVSPPSETWYFYWNF